MLGCGPDSGKKLNTHDPVGRLQTLLIPRLERTSFAYDLAGNVRRKELANGTWASHSYDEGNRLVRLRNLTSTNATIASFEYDYDCRGNKRQAREGDGTVVRWQYDGNRQLLAERRTPVSGPDVYHTTFTYDAVGNRLRRHESGALTTYLYDAANELLHEDSAAGRTTYSYDESGNRVEKEPPVAGTTYCRWDEQHRLLAAEPVAGPVTMAYNARGLRVQKETPSDVQHFLYDFQKVLQEYDGARDVQQEYTWTLREFGSLLSQYDGTDSSFYHYGEPGSTAALTNPAQTSTDEWIYRAFGEVESRLGSTETPFTFVGREGYYADPEIDLYYLRARYYDSSSGRFLNEDPLGCLSASVCRATRPSAASRTLRILLAKFLDMVPGTRACRVTGGMVYWAQRAVAAAHPTIPGQPHPGTEKTHVEAAQLAVARD